MEVEEYKNKLSELGVLELFTHNFTDYRKDFASESLDQFLERCLPDSDPILLGFFWGREFKLWSEVSKKIGEKGDA